jgi:hypothetical protein
MFGKPELTRTFWGYIWKNIIKLNVERIKMLGYGIDSAGSD